MSWLELEDKRVKGEPYENDKLFMYLWRRGFGTSEYSANPFTRMLDRWVARKCRYDKARPNYWMLNEIPKRLEAHAYPRQVVFLKKMPMTKTGKILKHELRRMHETGFNGSGFKVS